MKKLPLASVVLCGLLAAATVQAADQPVLPDPALTPGAVASTDKNIVCAPGYSKSVRHTPSWLKAKVYRKYGIPRHAGPYEMDHLIPLGIGGADVEANLWPETRAPQRDNAYDKDRLEFKLYELVCHHGLDIRVAQHDIAANWILAYKKYCPTDAVCPSFDDVMGTHEDEGRGRREGRR